MVSFIKNYKMDEHSSESFAFAFCLLFKNIYILMDEGTEGNRRINILANLTIFDG
jgi:hypothetical protein